MAELRELVIILDPERGFGVTDNQKFGYLRR